MLCPKCKIDSFRVEDSRPYYDCDTLHCLVIRRRKCFACGYEQKTAETVEKLQTICGNSKINNHPC